VSNWEIGVEKPKPEIIDLRTRISVYKLTRRMVACTARRAKFHRLYNAFALVVDPFHCSQYVRGPITDI